VELKHYLRILGLRWRIMLLPVLLVSVIAVYRELARPPTYSTEVRASVIRDLDPPPPDAYAYDGYYNYLASEFAIDDLVEALRGNVFAEAVAQRIVDAGGSATAGDVRSVLAVARKHRIVTMTTSSSDSARVTEVAAAAEAELEQNAFQYISVSAEDPSAMVRIIQRPETPSQDATRQRMLIGMELLAALALGVLLAFVVHFLDDRMHDAETVGSALRLPILAELPVERR
jgi:capsular polysaccharide biosynthesis protein